MNLQSADESECVNEFHVCNHDVCYAFLIKIKLLRIYSNNCPTCSLIPVQRDIDKPIIKRPT